MRSVKHAGLVQDRRTAAWYVEGIWPLRVRMKLTCRDVHALVSSGKISNEGGLYKRRVLLA